MPQKDVQVRVQAIDEFSRALTAFQKALQESKKSADSTEKAIGALNNRMGTFGSVLQGLAQGMGQAVWFQFEGYLSRLEGLLPNLVQRGQDYALRIEQLQDVTGMTAEQTSTLVAVMEHLGINTDMVDRSMAMFGKNLATNEDLFTQLGIATRDANGQLLDAYTIIGNTRRRFAEAGNALTTTAAAQELFSRSGYKLLDFLTLTDEQFKALADDARAAGVVLNQDTVAAAERMERTWAGFWQQINGLAVEAFAALEPTLEWFVSNFRAWVKNNLDAILSFIVQVANFILGFIGGLFGFSDAGQDVAASLVDVGESSDAATAGMTRAEKATKGATSAADSYTRAIKDQIAAIDARIKALREQRSELDAERQQADLEQAIADARAELAALQESQVNTYGLSEAERILALQKRQADLAAASGKVGDAEKRLVQFKEDQALSEQESILQAEREALQKRLELYQQHHSAVAGSVKGMAAFISGKLDPAITKASDTIDKFKGAAEYARQKGQEFANWIRGTLVPRLQDVWKFFGDVATLLGNLLGLNLQIGPFRLNIVDLAGALLLLVNPVGGGLILLINHLGDVGNIIKNIGDWVKWLIDQVHKIPGYDLIFGGGNFSGRLDEITKTMLEQQKAIGTVISTVKTLITLVTTLIKTILTSMFGTVGRASGGPVNFGQSAIVGEEGMEKLTWRPGGVQITPIEKTSGGSYVTAPIYLVVGGEVVKYVEQRLALTRATGPRRVQPVGVR